MNNNYNNTFIGDAQNPGNSEAAESYFNAFMVVDNGTDNNDLEKRLAEINTDLYPCHPLYMTGLSKEQLGAISELNYANLTDTGENVAILRALFNPCPEIHPGTLPSVAEVFSNMFSGNRLYTYTINTVDSGTGKQYELFVKIELFGQPTACNAPASEHSADEMPNKDTGIKNFIQYL